MQMNSTADARLTWLCNTGGSMGGANSCQLLTGYWWAKFVYYVDISCQIEKQIANNAKPDEANLSIVYTRR